MNLISFVSQISPIIIPKLHRNLKPKILPRHASPCLPLFFSDLHQFFSSKISYEISIQLGIRQKCSAFRLLQLLENIHSILCCSGVSTLCHLMALESLKDEISSLSVAKCISITVFQPLHIGIRLC